MNVFYRRVSTEDQNLDRQEPPAGVEKIFEDKLSGKNTERPALQEMIAYVREGDKVIVHSMDRLSRNVVDLCTLIKDLNSKQVAVEFITEHLCFAGDNSPIAMMQLQIMGAVHQFMRANLKLVQAEGIAKAKAKGKYKGRNASLSELQIAEIKASTEPKVTIAKQYQVSRQTIHRVMKGTY